MNVRATLAVIVAFVGIGLIADPAMAKEIPLQSKKQVKKDCDASGGTYWPSSAGGTWGCVNTDGSGIICGGVRAHDKKTCGTFRKGSFRLPTREEVDKIESKSPE